MLYHPPLGGVIVNMAMLVYKGPPLVGRFENPQQPPLGLFPVSINPPLELRQRYPAKLGLLKWANPPLWGGVNPFK